MAGLPLLLLLRVICAAPAAAAQSFLVTGAAGKTGSLIYKSLKASQWAVESFSCRAPGLAVCFVWITPNEIYRGARN
jgi:hypothetical protein